MIVLRAVCFYKNVSCDIYELYIFVVQGSIVFDQIDAATKFRNTLSLTALALLLSSCKVVKTFSFKAYNDKLII